MLDNAVVLFGTSLEGAMNEARNAVKTDKRKQQAAYLVWARWLEVPQEQMFKGSTG